MQFSQFIALYHSTENAQNERKSDGVLRLSYLEGVKEEVDEELCEAQG